MQFRLYWSAYGCGGTECGERIFSSVGMNICLSRLRCDPGLICFDWLGLLREIVLQVQQELRHLSPSGMPVQSEWNQCYYQVSYLRTPCIFNYSFWDIQFMIIILKPSLLRAILNKKSALIIKYLKRIDENG